MNILYIIGNGFDINLGLKTGYQDFYNYYIEQQSSDDVIVKLKEHMTAHLYTTWADLEMGLGLYTKEVGSWRDMEIICHDLSINMRKYLSQIQKGFMVTEDERRRMVSFLLEPQSGLGIGNARAVSSAMVAEKHINVINFNYTKTFEQLCGYRKGNQILSNTSTLHIIHHIHLSLENQDVIIGVNDEGQVSNKEIICPELKDLMIKPHINNQLGTLVDDECLDMIDKASLICFFGVSLGESDLYWWRRVGNRMKTSNAVLIYYAFDQDNPIYNNQLIGKRRSFLSLIADRCNIPIDNEALISRIFIGYKTRFFKIR